MSKTKTPERRPDPTPAGTLAHIMKHAEPSCPQVGTIGGWSTCAGGELYTGIASNAPAVAVHVVRGCGAAALTPEMARRLAANLIELADKADAQASAWMERHTGTNGEFVD